MREKLERLKTILHDVDDLGKAAAMLEWDMQTYMPSGGAETRSWQMSTLQRMAHEKFVTRLRMIFITIFVRPNEFAHGFIWI